LLSRVRDRSYCRDRQDWIVHLIVAVQHVHLWRMGPASVAGKVDEASGRASVSARRWAVRLSGTARCQKTFSPFKAKH